MYRFPSSTITPPSSQGLGELDFKRQWKKRQPEEHGRVGKEEVSYRSLVSHPVRRLRRGNKPIGRKEHGSVRPTLQKSQCSNARLYFSGRATRKAEKIWELLGVPTWRVQSARSRSDLVWLVPPVLFGVTNDEMTNSEWNCAASGKLTWRWRRQRL